VLLTSFREIASRFPQCQGFVRNDGVGTAIDSLSFAMTAWRESTHRLSQPFAMTRQVDVNTPTGTYRFKQPSTMRIFDLLT
jgi:hypothetical protein